MNKVALFLGAMIAFLIPVGVVISMNLGQLHGSSGAQQKSTGKLVYYYSPS